MASSGEEGAGWVWGQDLHRSLDSTGRAGGPSALHDAVDLLHPLRRGPPGEGGKVKMEGGRTGELHEGKLAGEGEKGRTCDKAGSGHPWVPGTRPWWGVAPTRVSVLSNWLMTWVMKVFILSKSEGMMLPEPSMRKTMSEAFLGQPGGRGEECGVVEGKMHSLTLRGPSIPASGLHHPVGPIYPCVWSSPPHIDTTEPINPSVRLSLPHRAPHPIVRPPHTWQGGRQGVPCRQEEAEPMQLHVDPTGPLRRGAACLWAKAG